MDLSNELISQFVKITNDKNKKTEKTYSYGTVVENNGEMYVKLDGSDLLTPVDTSFVLHVDDRVMVDIKNHHAMVSANLTNPSVGSTEISASENKVVESLKEGYAVGITTISKNGITVSHTETGGRTKLDKDGFHIGTEQSDVISYTDSGLQIDAGNFSVDTTGKMITNDLLIQNRLCIPSDNYGGEIYETDALNEICSTPVYSFISNDTANKIGLDIYEVPEDILGLSGIDLYQMVVMLWRAVQQLNNKIDNS